MVPAALPTPIMSRSPAIPSLREHVPKQPQGAATYHDRRDEHGCADSVSRKEEAAGNTDDNAWPKANPESGRERLPALHQFSITAEKTLHRLPALNDRGVVGARRADPGQAWAGCTRASHERSWRLSSGAGTPGILSGTRIKSTAFSEGAFGLGECRRRVSSPSPSAC